MQILSFSIRSFIRIPNSAFGTSTSKAGQSNCKDSKSKMKVKKMKMKESKLWHFKLLWNGCIKGCSYVFDITRQGSPDSSLCIAPSYVMMCLQDVVHFAEEFILYGTNLLLKPGTRFIYLCKIEKRAVFMVNSVLKFCLVLQTKDTRLTREPIKYKCFYLDSMATLTITEFKSISVLTLQPASTRFCTSSTKTSCHTSIKKKKNIIF